MAVKNLQEEKEKKECEDEEDDEGEEKTDDEEKITDLCSVDGKCFIGFLFSFYLVHPQF